MKNALGKALLALCLIASPSFCATLENHPLWKADSLPDLYYEVMAASIPRALELQAPDGRFRQTPPSGDESGWAVTLMQYIYAPALLYATQNPFNPYYQDKKLLDAVLKAGDYIASCIQPDGAVVVKVNGKTVGDLDIDRSIYCLAEAMGVLKDRLDPRRLKTWSTALGWYGDLMERQIRERQDRPRYTSPFLGTSPNHLGWWDITLLKIGIVLERQDFIAATLPSLNRYVRQITPGGYWQEHNGPMMSYDYLNVGVTAIYWHYASDPAAWEALAANTNYHIHWTTPDGVDIQTIDQRNRSDFTVMSTAWDRALMAFSHFPAGRRFARFKLLAALGDSHDPVESLGLRTLGHLAADAYYHTPGPEAQIPQEMEHYSHTLDRPAIVRKQGPWVYSLCAILSPERPLSQFYLDRTCPVSLWNEKTRCIIGGGNSKGQPELATFAVRHGDGAWSSLPLDALLAGGGDSDTLCVAHEGYSLRLTFELATESSAVIHVLAEHTYDTPDTAFLNLPLRLAPGQQLTIGGGPARTLDAGEIRLAGKALAGGIAYGRWRMEVPPEARFVWPFYVYSPYGEVRVPKNLEAAVGVLSLPLAPSGAWQTVKIRIE